MTTMKEQRIVEILGDLSDRVAHISCDLCELMDDFNNRNRPNMQIRKDANRLINDGCVLSKRFFSIAKNFGMDLGNSMYDTFLCRYDKFTSRASFFE